MTFHEARNVRLKEMLWLTLHSNLRYPIFNKSIELFFLTGSKFMKPMLRSTKDFEIPALFVSSEICIIIIQHLLKQGGG